MANELARHGVRCRIIDHAAERSQTSRALAIFPRTLEAFETMGLADSFVALGLRLHGLSLHHGQEEVAQIDLTSVASPFPFALGLPQSETERLLGENLSSLGIQVERGVELTGLTQTSDAVRAILREQVRPHAEEIATHLSRQLREVSDDFLRREGKPETSDQ